MKNFKELDKRNVHEVESNMSQKWQEMDILNLSIENRAKNKNWVFYDGPIYAKISVKNVIKLPQLILVK